MCFGSNREDQARRRVPPSLVEAQVRHHRVQKLWAVPGEGLRLAGPREVLALSRSNDYRLAETLGVAFFSVPTISARSTRRSSRSSTRTSPGRPAGFSTTSPRRSPRWHSASARSRAFDRSSTTRGRCPRLETKDGWRAELGKPYLRVEEEIWVKLGRVRVELEIWVELGLSLGKSKWRRRAARRGQPSSGMADWACGLGCRRMDRRVELVAC